MSATPSIRTSPNSSEATLDIGEVGDRVCGVFRAADGHGYTKKTATNSLMMVAGEVRAASENALSNEVMASKLAEMLCSVVYLAKVCEVDIAAATLTHLQSEEQRRGMTRPQLRSVD